MCVCVCVRVYCTLNGCLAIPSVSRTAESQLAESFGTNIKQRWLQGYIRQGGVTDPPGTFGLRTGLLPLDHISVFSRRVGRGELSSFFCQLLLDT